MENKSFHIPPECKHLILFFWDLKHYACEELKEKGIDKEPAQTEFEALQVICDDNPSGSLAKYVRELQKCFRMSKEELLEYNEQIRNAKQPTPTDAPLDLDSSIEMDFDVPEDSDMEAESKDSDIPEEPDDLDLLAAYDDLDEN